VTGVSRAPAHTQRACCPTHLRIAGALRARVVAAAPRRHLPGSYCTHWWSLHAPSTSLLSRLAWRACSSWRNCARHVGASRSSPMRAHNAHNTPVHTHTHTRTHTHTHTHARTLAHAPPNAHHQLRYKEPGKQMYWPSSSEISPRTAEMKADMGSAIDVWCAVPPRVGCCVRRAVAACPTRSGRSRGTSCGGPGLGWLLPPTRSRLSPTGPHSRHAFLAHPGLHAVRTHTYTHTHTSAPPTPRHTQQAGAEL
jgi:hypothetical protein